MTDQAQEPEAHLRQQAAVDDGQTLGIDNTDTALAPEETGYTPDQEPEDMPAGKGSDPGLRDLPSSDE